MGFLLYLGDANGNAAMNNASSSSATTSTTGAKTKSKTTAAGINAMVQQQRDHGEQQVVLSASKTNKVLLRPTRVGMIIGGQQVPGINDL